MRTLVCHSCFSIHPSTSRYCNYCGAYGAFSDQRRIERIRRYGSRQMKTWVRRCERNGESPEMTVAILCCLRRTNAR